MVPKTTLLTRLAMVMCGAMIGAATLVALISTALRWLNLAPMDMPLAVAGGLAGACVVLVALALSSPSPSASEQERHHAALVWMAPDPALMTPMAWTLAPMILSDSFASESLTSTPESARAAVRRQTTASPHCSGRRPARRPISRRAYRPRRALPLPPSEA